MDLYKNVELRKAVSMSLFLKECNVSSAVHDYSVNKLHLMTGLSAGVIKKRVEILVIFGLAEFVGKNKNILVFRTLKSGTKHRNVFVKCNEFNSDDKIRKNKNAQKVKHIDDMLCIAMITEIQKHKDYAKHMIQKRENPENVKEFKDARSSCKRAGWNNHYVEYGLSYKTIANKIGVGCQKAFLLIKKAISQKIMDKINNIRKVYCPGVSHIKDMIKSYTYIYNNNVYKVSANTYVIL